MENLLKNASNAKTKVEKQALSAQLVSCLPQFLEELGELEQGYYRGLKNCVESEGSKSGGELLMFETDIYKKYKAKKRLYEAVLATLKVLDMYTGRE